MKRLFLAFLVSAVLHTTNAGAGYADSNAAIMQARSCGSWFADRRSPDAALGNTAWIAGYLTGAGGKDLMRGLDRQALELRMDDYCRRNPGSDIENGAGELLRELRRQAGGG